MGTVLCLAKVLRKQRTVPGIEILVSYPHALIHFVVLKLIVEPFPFRLAFCPDKLHGQVRRMSAV